MGVKSFGLKRICFFFLFGAVIVWGFFSCKHQPLDTTPPGGSTGGGGVTTVTCSADTAYFQQQVLPVFISNCAVSGCHDAASHQKGVVLTDYANIVSTGDVRAGRPDNSKVWKMINETDPAKRMPPLPRSPLTQAQKDLIGKWITQGARNNSCQASACDTVTVTFSGAVKNIINNKCLGCHNGTAASAGINLSAHAGIKAKVDDGRLWGTINHLSGYSPMPKGGSKLSDCEIAQFRKWIAAGAPNN